VKVARVLLGCSVWLLGCCGWLYYLVLIQADGKDDADKQQNDSQSHEDEREMRDQSHDQQQLLNPRGRSIVNHHRLQKRDQTMGH